MSEPIRAKVAEIINRRELVINAGSEHGVVKGMKFAVLSRKGASIKDPDTGEELGSVDVPKVLVEAVRVQPKLTIARTFTSRRRNVGGRGLGLDLFQPPRWVEEVETLRTSDKPYVEELSEEESYVKIGDPVVQVLGDEFLA